MRNIIFGLALVVGGLLPCTARAQQFMLVCHLVPEPGLVGSPMDVNFRVDPDMSTVDDHPAKIGDAAIGFEYTNSKGTPYYVKINRVTGSVYIGTNLGS